MERRVRGNPHARCGAGEKVEITSKFYLLLLLERQREGIAIAKSKGAYKGRKKVEKPDNWDEVYPRWKNRELTAGKAMELLGLKRNTFYKLVSEVG